MYNNVDKIDTLKISEVSDPKQIIIDSKVQANKIYDINLDAIA